MQSYIITRRSPAASGTKLLVSINACGQGHLGALTPGLRSSFVLDVYTRALLLRAQKKKNYLPRAESYNPEDLSL